MLFQAVRGTRDIFAPLADSFVHFETIARQKAALWGFKELRFPTLEEARLFARGVGETTDIVEKEMYVFNDKGGRALALRPEGTASCVRAYIENEISKKEKKSKFFYIGNMFRAEKPQAGRWREFEQIGFEILGESEHSAEAELIAVAYEIYKAFGLERCLLHINSLGCRQCRNPYTEELKSSLKPLTSSLCEDCQRRLERNPLRVLDCKKCSSFVLEKTKPFERCSECQKHEDGLFHLLKELNTPYQHNPKIVRGFDYYTRTVFEFIHPQLGAQSAICSGGRYDNLVELLGGPKTPAVGLAFGVDRSIEAWLKENPAAPTEKSGVFVAVAAASDNLVSYAFKTMTLLRQHNKAVDYSMFRDSLKSQMRQADKGGFRYCLVIGEEEWKNKNYALKDLATGEEEKLSPQDLLKKLRC